MTDDHEVLISGAHIAATCSCGWISSAVENYDAKRAGADRHMYDHYSVFVESIEDDGTTVLCWGTR